MNLGVTLSAPSQFATTVNYATADGTAVAGTDYTETNGTLTIPAGSTTGTIPVTILGKSAAGPTKTFTVNLSAPDNATIATGTATGTITNPNSAGPQPTSFSPDQLGQSASSIPVVISGNAFITGATVKVSGTGVTLSKVSVVNATTISASATVSSSAAPGVRNITVTDSQGSGVCTGCLTIDPRPTVTSASPSGVSQGAAGSVTFTGSGFVTGATIKVTGPATTVKATKVTVSTSSTLSATITVPAAAPLGAYTVTVTNADGGKGTCTNCLSVIAAPTLTGISPSSVAPGTTKSVVISGTGFATGATLKGPSGVTFSKIVIVNSTTITASMKVASTATAGSNLAITMTNSEAAGFGKAVGDVLTIT
jgi:hypothetical protein